MVAFGTAIKLLLGMPKSYNEDPGLSLVSISIQLLFKETKENATDDG